jgi:hypothetical protein
MKDFLPAAQAVMDDAVEVNDLVCCDSIAAVLRAAADHLYDSASQDYLWKLANELEQLDD